MFDDNWERAELFVVPVLMVLAYWEHWGPDPGCNGISLNEQLDITGKALLEPLLQGQGRPRPPDRVRPPRLELHGL